MDAREGCEESFLDCERRVEDNAAIAVPDCEGWVDDPSLL